jgi:hypothetical protein
MAVKLPSVIQKQPEKGFLSVAIFFMAAYDLSVSNVYK